MSKKQEFMDALRHYLSDFGNGEREEILYDYEEHFRIGMESGKTEDELIKELGSPRDIAAQYRNSDDNVQESSDVSPRHGAGGSIVMFIVLFIFNFFIGIWVFITAACTLIAMFLGAISVVIAGVAVSICIVIRPMIPENVNIPAGIPDISVFFTGIGTTALGILFCIGMFYLVKYFMAGTVKYVNWNIKTIKGA